MKLWIRFFSLIAIALPLFLYGLASASGPTIERGVLHLQLENPTSGVKGGIKKILVNWNENTVTWNSIQGQNNLSGFIDYQDIEDTESPYEVEFIISGGQLQSWSDNPSTNYGLACLNDGSTGDTEMYHFFARHSSTASRRPWLGLFYHYPGQPTQYKQYDCIADTYIEEGDPTYNNGQSGDIHAGFIYPRPPNGFFIALLKFEPIDAVEDAHLTNSEIPKTYALHQNYPNPFNSETAIRFDIPLAGLVNLNIYNVNGQLLRKLVESDMEAGSYEVRWDGRNDRDQEVTSGLYFCWLFTEYFSKSIKLVFIK